MQTPLSVKSGRLALTVLPDCGARVQQVTYDGRELLSGPGAHPDNWGATYWTSPQADWGWPPVAEVDSAPYEVIAADSPLEVALSSSPAVIGQRRFRIEKRFAPRAHDCIDTEYRIVNLGSEPFAMASWEISRVPPAGLTFFPSGSSVQTPIPPHSELLFEQELGVSFYDHSGFQTGLSRKVHADGREGFLGHLLTTEGADDLLLLKVFADSRPEQQAPGEGEVELFANFDGQYVEVEVQGTYEQIAAGASSAFVVRTTVVPVPRGLRNQRAALVELARAAVARVR